MMIGHRLSDDYLLRQGHSLPKLIQGLPKARLWDGLTRIHWESMRQTLRMLFLFWIPAHTLTFLLPEHFQVTVAAVWAIALGAMLGSFSRAARQAA
jgi:hypothetical protein